MTIKQTTIYNAAIDGLISANKNNPFWNKSDAMQLINLVRRNAK